MNGGPPLFDHGRFGHAIASVGDLDGDGTDDLVAGSDRDDTGGRLRGAVYVLLLNPDGTVKTSTKIASDTNGGPTLNDYDRFGGAVTSVGDLDSDGVPDIALGASFDDTNGGSRGAVYLLFMNPDGSARHFSKIASDTNDGPTLVNGDLLATP